MHIARIILAVLTALLATPTWAERERWSVIDGWNISYYPSLQGCLAYASFDGTAFFIGYDTVQTVPALDITVLNEKWTQFKKDGLYPITLQFGDQPPWTLEMQGVHMDGAPGLNILIDARIQKSALFIEEFQRETEMSWTDGNDPLGAFTLRGSMRAFDQVIACQDAHAPAQTAQTDSDVKPTASE